MKYIRNHKFEELEQVYPNKSGLKFLDRATIIKKIDKEDLTTVKELQQKKKMGNSINKVILPDELYKILFTYTLYDVYAYTMEYQRDFYPLSSFEYFEHRFSEREILTFYRDLLIGLGNMHQNGIFSGDMWSQNILMNDCLDYRFTDLEKGITDLNQDPKIPEEVLLLNYYDSKMLDSRYSVYGQMELSDKLSLFNNILYSMQNGSFPEQREVLPILIFDEFDFPCGIDQKIMEYLSLADTESNDSLIDIMDTLIQKEYKLPYRKVCTFRETI